MAETSSHVFVTGNPRSGTTLLDKLISRHPRACVLSQPLPLLFVRLKRDFLAAAGREVPPYPLDDMFVATSYPAARLVDYLEARRLEARVVREVLEEMRHFSGQYTKPSDPLFFLRRYEARKPYDFWRDYCRLLVDPETEIVGSKETFCEEFIPYFLGEGARVIAVVRDPRDVLTSLGSGSGPDWAGRPKPALFNIRLWRKSIAFCLEHEDDPAFLCVRYEELVGDPGSVLGRIAGFLGLEPFPEDVLLGPLQDQDGRPWRSNSSHEPTDRVETSSVGRYRDLLPEATRLLVEACCYPELRCLGYSVGIEAGALTGVVSDYREIDSAVERAELVSYALTPARRHEELERWRLLRHGTYDSRYFAFPDVFWRLRQALGAEGLGTS